MSLPIPTPSVQSNPREQMRQDLPGWMQPVLTAITAKPYRGQPPSKRTPIQYLIGAAVKLVLGISFSTIAIVQPEFLGLLPVGWLLTISSLRALQVVILHHCAHLNVTKNKATDTLIGQVISILLVIPDFSFYAKNHRTHHALKGHLTKQDETLQFLFNRLKLHPGMSQAECWKRLRRSLWSPRFHLQFFWDRFRGCFLSRSSLHREAAFFLWMLVLRGVLATHTEVLFLVAWIIPATVGYQICATLRLVVEHEFPSLELLTHRDKRFVAEATKAVFLGESTPEPTLKGVSKLLAWSGWFFRMLIFHGLLCRLMIMQGDTPVHDVHTRNPGSDDWANAIWVREAELEEGCSRWPSPYAERWGLTNAIDGVFESISKLPSDLTF